MPISLRLYGDLKAKVSGSEHEPGRSQKISLSKDRDNITNISDILRKFNLTAEQLSHIFVNGKYCGPGTELQEGDRVGLFPANMGLIFAEIEKNHPIPVRVRLPKSVASKINKSEGIVRVPSGSTVAYLLNKFNLLNKFSKLEITINQQPSVGKEYILEEDDFIEIKYS